MVVNASHLRIIGQSWLPARSSRFEALVEQGFGDALPESSILGANPIFGLPVFLAVIGRPVYVEVPCAPGDARSCPGVVPQQQSLHPGIIKGTKWPIDVVAVIDDVPVHLFTLIRQAATAIQRFYCRE